MLLNSKCQAEVVTFTEASISSNIQTQLELVVLMSEIRYTFLDCKEKVLLTQVVFDGKIVRQCFWTVLS